MGLEGLSAVPKSELASEKAPKKDKYAVNVIFDGAQEEAIRHRAKELGVGVATYIKMLVAKDLNGVS